VREGSRLEIEFSAWRRVRGKIRWTRENRVGIAFDQPLERSADGSFEVLSGKSARGHTRRSS
jgi:hypothetical protein